MMENFILSSEKVLVFLKYFKIMIHPISFFFFSTFLRQAIRQYSPHHPPPSTKQNKKPN